jgi:hypothetical protein
MSPASRVMRSPSTSRAKAPPSEQVINDQVTGAGREVGRNRARGWRAKTPRRREFSIEEHGPVEFHDLQHFRKYIYLSSRDGR